MSEPTCYCGHVYDEHLDTVMAPCDVEGCPCAAFDEEPSDE